MWRLQPGLASGDFTPDMSDKEIAEFLPDGLLEKIRSEICGLLAPSDAGVRSQDEGPPTPPITKRH